MATITSTPTGGNLTVNGTTQKTGTISWTKLTVPSGTTISSCVLTGTATASMSKGSATITVNGTTVTSGTQFTINLGTANNTTSVTTTAKGGNKQSKGTVSFSNLVYTVTYEEAVQVKTYTVTFVGWNGTVLKTQTVEEGSSATEPDYPYKEGYNFTGWDKSFDNITSDLTVTAQYSIKTYEVIFKDDDGVGTTLSRQTVNHGSAAIAPSDPSKEGYIFVGWDVDFSNVTSDLFVIAQYEKLVTTIEWSGLGTVASGLRAHDVEHDNYKINLDWDNEYFDIIVTEDFNYLTGPTKYVNIASLDKIIIGSNQYSAALEATNGSMYIRIVSPTANESPKYEFELNYPFTIRFAKEGVYILHGSTNHLIMERNYDLDTIYFNEDKADNIPLGNVENGDYDVAFDLAVSEYSGQTEEPELEVIEWTGIGTVATNLSTEDAWTYKLNIDWDTQYIEINNIVAHIEIFRHGANVLYLNNEYDLSTGDLIYCDETSMVTIDSSNYYGIDFLADEFSIKISKDNGFTFYDNYSGELFTIENYSLIEDSSTLYLSSLVHKESGDSTIGEIKVVALEEPEEPTTPPIQKTIVLRPISATQDSGYNNTWTNIANTYDTDTSTNGTIIVTGSSQTGFKRKYVDTLFNFDNPIPADAIINSAVLTVRAKQSATTNLNMIVSINGNEVIGSTLLTSSTANYTADVVNYIKDLNQLNINLTSAATSNRTFTLYDICIDVDYLIIESEEPEEPETPDEPEGPSSFMFNGMPINVMFLGEDKIIAIFMGDNKLF